MSGLRDITTKSAVRVLTVVYLLYCVFPDGCALLLPLPPTPGIPPHAYDPMIFAIVLTLAAAVALTLSFRVGVGLTFISQIIQTFAITSPFLRYVIYIGPSAWISLNLSFADWHLSPRFHATDHKMGGWGFSHIPDIQGFTVGLNLVPIGVMAVLWWVARYHQAPRGRTSAEPAASA